MSTRPTGKKNASSKPTLSDLAAHLSLSKGTVSLILNHRGGRFAEETRNRVLAAAQEIGYSPDPLARALATGRTGFVSLWLQTLVTSYHAQVAHAMEEALEAHGYQIAVTPFGRFNLNREAYSGAPAGVDAMIAHEIYGDIVPLLFRKTSRKVPIVTTGIFKALEGCDHVHVDLTAAAEEAVRHLVQRGYQRIAYAPDDMLSRSLDKRFVTYRRVLAESSLQPELISLSSQDRHTVRASLREYIQAHGVPRAILCHNDDIAVAAYRALMDLGLHIPEDCALVGCNGIPDTEFLSVPITTIVQPYTAMCDTACQFLERRLAEPDAEPQQVSLAARLEIRQSS